jgi:hypothetical protein
LLADFPEVEVDIYSEDTPAHTLDDLLANPHIQVVDLVLPISIVSLSSQNFLKLLSRRSSNPLFCVKLGLQGSILCVTDPCLLRS